MVHSPLAVLFCLLPSLVVSSQPCIVLTLDVSESMERQDRLDTLRVALYKWFLVVPDEVLLGMVTFSTEGELLSELTTSREELMNDIPSEGQGDTCIGCGIHLALQVLRERDKTGVIVLITDGQNTVQGQFISDVEDDVVKSRNKVVAVGFGDIAPLEDLEGLALKTGGRFFDVPDGTGDSGLRNALNFALELAEWQLTTTESSTSEAKALSLLPTEENSSTVSASTHPSRYKNKPKNQSSSFNEPPPKYHHASSYWLIIGLLAAIVGALMLVGVIILVLWRQLFVPRINGFYQVAYADSSNK